jgi:hypothetical protein
MSRRLAITVSDEVYEGLHARIGARKTGQFIDRIVRPHDVDEAPRPDTIDAGLPAAYREAASDKVAETEAQEWLELDVASGLDQDQTDAPRCDL